MIYITSSTVSHLLCLIALFINKLIADTQTCNTTFLSVYKLSLGMLHCFHFFINQVFYIEIINLDLVLCAWSCLNSQWIQSGNWLYQWMYLVRWINMIFFLHSIFYFSYNYTLFCNVNSFFLRETYFVWLIFCTTINTISTSTTLKCIWIILFYFADKM